MPKTPMTFEFEEEVVDEVVSEAEKVKPKSSDYKEESLAKRKKKMYERCEYTNLKNSLLTALVRALFTVVLTAVILRKLQWS